MFVYNSSFFCILGVVIVIIIIINDVLEGGLVTKTLQSHLTDNKRSRVDGEVAQVLASSPKDVTNSTCSAVCSSYVCVDVFLQKIHLCSCSVFLSHAEPLLPGKSYAGCHIISKLGVNREFESWTVNGNESWVKCLIAADTRAYSDRRRVVILEV